MVSQPYRIRSIGRPAVHSGRRISTLEWRRTTDPLWVSSTVGCVVGIVGEKRGLDSGIVLNQDLTGNL